jgi:hypothetical protein
LGDRVRLRIEDVSMAQRKVLAVPAEMPTLPPPSAPARPPTRSRPPRAEELSSQARKRGKQKRQQRQARGKHKQKRR